jgi:hypothetical protein
MTRDEVMAPKTRNRENTRKITVESKRMETLFGGRFTHKHGVKLSRAIMAPAECHLAARKDDKFDTL